MAKMIQIRPKFQKTIKKPTKSSKVLPVYSPEQPFATETFLKFRKPKKDCLGKYETLRVSY